MKKLVIFDLDGTLLNTIHDLGEAANYALAQNGFQTHHVSSYPHFVGNGITKLIERVLPSDARDADTVARLRKDFLDYYDKHMTDHSAPYPGIDDLLRDLTGAGIGIAVASNKYHDGAVKLINHFFGDIPWVAIEGQRPDIPTKPDPSVVFGILAAHPTPKSEVLYVGDSAVDIETAHRASVDFVGVNWGFGSEKELTDNYAERITGNPADIYDIARGIIPPVELDATL